MIDLYLRTVSEQELIDGLSFAHNNDGWILSSHDYALDIIGDLYNDDAIFDEDGNITTPATKKTGFHANLRCTQAIADLVSENIQVIPPPISIRRIWA